MKLVLLCYSVKLLPGSKYLTIRRTWSILNSHIFLNGNSFWLSGCIYLLTSKTVLSFLAFLNAELTGSMFRKISITLSLGTFIAYVTRSLLHIFRYPFKEDGPLTSLSMITCKLASDISLPILLSLWSASRLLSVRKLIVIPWNFSRNVHIVW